MSKIRPAMRRYTVRLAAAMTGYILTLFIATHLFRTGQASGAIGWFVAFLPGLCIAAVFWAVGRLLIEETDEYVRMLLVRQVLIATGVTMAIATIYGFLENFGLVPHIDAFYLTVLWFIGFGIGGIVNRVTYGSTGGCR